MNIIHMDDGGDAQTWMMANDHCNTQDHIQWVVNDEHFLMLSLPLSPNKAREFRQADVGFRHTRQYL